MVVKKSKAVTKKELVDFIQQNKGKGKIGFYIIGGLLVLFGLLWVTTRQPKMPADIKATIDSLINVNKQLIEHQKQIDSTIAIYETEINQIDNQVDNIKEKTTIVREYYHEVGQQAGKYTPTQVDSFFKARYNY
jgi:predicted nucleic-acid-binding protein